MNRKVYGISVVLDEQNRIRIEQDGSYEEGPEVVMVSADQVDLLIAHLNEAKAAAAEKTGTY